MSAFLLPFLFLLVSAVVIPNAYAALRTGQLRIKGGAIVKKEEKASVFWLCLFGEALVVVVLVSLGVFGTIAAIQAHIAK